MTTALFIGRFQPFHLGHLLAIREILQRNDFVIIGIGSSKKSNTPTNPFTFKERKEMIEAALKEEGISNYKIVEIPDVNDDIIWAEQIKKSIKFDIAYTNNKWVKDCFEKIGAHTKKTKIYGAYKAERVRELIANGQYWKDQVPTAVYEYVTKISGDKRIKKLLMS